MQDANSFDYVTSFSERRILKFGGPMDIFSFHNEKSIETHT
jgi:hypothetical protein